MIFGTPVWLWLASAALIPVFIHIWNKRSGTPRLLGTFRFLPEESFAAAKKIELHEIPLMIVRMLMVVILAFLLAGVFLEEERKGVEHVIISEVSGDEFSTDEMEEGAVVSVSSDQLEEQGWWNILEQVVYRQQPERVTVRGAFSEENFGGPRPALDANVDWETADSLYKDEMVLAAWEVSEEQYRVLIQRRTEAGIQTYIEEMEQSEFQNRDIIQVMEEPRLFLNPDNEEAVNAGLEYAADLWEIETVEQPMTEFAWVELGEHTFSLIQQMEAAGAEDVVEANSLFGISLSVKRMKADISYSKEIVHTHTEHIPFIYIDSDGNMVVNGIVESELQGWVYAAIASRMITETLGLNELLTPELTEHQRSLASNSSTGAASEPEKQQSAEMWLIGLLALCWLTERWLAPQRGM